MHREIDRPPKRVEKVAREAYDMLFATRSDPPAACETTCYESPEDNADNNWTVGIRTTRGDIQVLTIPQEWVEDPDWKRKYVARGLEEDRGWAHRYVAHVGMESLL